jgi:stress-induced morphogen
MPMPPADIERLIKEAFPNALIKLVDTAGDNDHYELTVITPEFAGKSKVKQHQMVYEALKGNMGQQLHALALKTAVPA